MSSKIPINPVPGCHDERRGGLEGGLQGVAEVGLCGEATRSGLCKWRRLAPLAAVVAVTGLVLLMGWHRQVTAENIVALRDRFHFVLAEHPFLSVAVYVATYAALASLSLPGCPIVTATGGLMFGWLLGGAASVLGATVGATVLFLIARSAVGGILSERTAPWLAKLRQGFKNDALSYLLFLRLVPAFPFWFVNIAPAILGVPLRTYVIATFIGIIPATFAFSSAGAGLDSVIMAAKADYARCVAENGSADCHLSIHASSLLTKELVLALLLLGVVALIPVALRRWRTRHAAAK